MTFLSRLGRWLASPPRSRAAQTRPRLGRLTSSGRPALEELEPRRLLSVPTPDHVVIVVEENHNYGQIIGSPAAPYLNGLAQAGVLFTDSYGLAHISEPNYLALFSGSTQGVSDDGTYSFTGPNLASSLLASGRSFGGYSEGLPYAGFTGATSGAYARKHNPWVSFTNVPSALNLPFSSFPGDYSRLPAVSFVVPDLNNDMHDGTVQQGDTWLRNNLDGYVQWANSHNSLLIVTWDEDANDGGNNHIPTLFVVPMVQPGSYSETITHYNVLRTVEDMYGLPYLGQDATLAPITDSWVAPPAPPALADPGFELPGVGTGTYAAYQYDPAGSPWTFTGTAGVAGNGSGFTAGNPDAPQGTQIAFLQGTGSISQAVPLADGAYALSFLAAQRGNVQASRQTVQVLVDGTGVGTFTPAGSSYTFFTTPTFAVAAGTHTITFAGTDPDGQDNTAFLDQVRISQVVAGTGFEAPDVGTGPGAYQYEPTGTAVTYTGTAGVAGNGSALGNPDAPQGAQVAFLQGQGTISGSHTFAAGTYSVTFLAAQGGPGTPGSQAFEVRVDGAVVGTFTPAGTAYAAYTTSGFTLTAGAHTITMAGTGPDGQDHTALIDQAAVIVADP